MTINPDTTEFNIIFGAEIFIVLLKFLIILYLGKKIAEQKKEKEAKGLDFLIGLLVLFIGLFTSRIFYVLFDFIYARFDFTVFHLPPNIWLWKFGMFFVSIGLGYLILILDKKVLNNKYKGIFAYIIFGGAVLVLFWPVQSQDDFGVISLFAIIPQVISLILPGLFLQIGRQSTGELRKVSYLLSLGFILYIIASFLVIAPFIEFMSETLERELVLLFYGFRAAFKCSALIIFAYGASKFGQ